MDFFTVGVILAILVLIISAIAKSTKRKELQKEYEIVKSLEELKDISKYSLVLLVAEQVVKIREYATRKGFDYYILPKILEPNKKHGNKICWSNIKDSEIYEWLQEKVEDIKGRGFFIIKDGNLIKHEIYSKVITKKSINNAVQFIESIGK